jgi:hypothetical protein
VADSPQGNKEQFRRFVSSKTPQRALDPVPPPDPQTFQPHPLVGFLDDAAPIIQERRYRSWVDHRDWYSIDDATPTPIIWIAKPRNPELDSPVTTFGLTFVVLPSDSGHGAADAKMLLHEGSETPNAAPCFVRDLEDEDAVFGALLWWARRALQRR